MPPTKRTAAVEGGNGPGGGLASSAGDLRPESERRPAAKVASCLRWCRRVGSGAAVGPSAGAPVGPNGRRRSDPIGFHRMPTSRFDMSTFAEKKIAVPFFFHFYRIFFRHTFIECGKKRLERLRSWFSFWRSHVSSSIRYVSNQSDRTLSYFTYCRFEIYD